MGFWEFKIKQPISCGTSNDTPSIRCKFGEKKELGLAA